MLNVLPTKAPRHIKPAWPKLSSPRIPTVRFSESAMITYAQIGTNRPLIRLEALGNPLYTIQNTRHATTIAYVIASFFAFLLSDCTFFFILATYTFSFIGLPRMPVGLTISTMIKTPNTIASDKVEEM